jgi:acyl-coenzyme A thioesterase PaaI-like protein
VTGFATASAVAPAGEDGTYAVRLDPGWTVGGKLNGGYLLATMGRAAADVAPHPHVLAASAHFLSAPEHGPARVDTTVLRTGRRATQVRARLAQEERVHAEALLTLGRLAGDAVPTFSDAPPAATPPLEDCPRVPSDPPGGPASRVALFDEVEVRLDPDTLGFAGGQPGGVNELRGWLRFADGHEADPLTLLFVLDAFPPATLDLGSSGWVPTLELTTYVRAVPAPGPLRVRQRARHVEDGLVDELCEVWDVRDRLVAHATQLAAVRMTAPAGQAGATRQTGPAGDAERRTA